MATLPSPNMNLPVPVVGQEVGPQWAIDINSCFSLLDSHNHTSGSGVQITPSAVDINSDLLFNGNNATLLRTARFQPQLTVPALASDVGCLSVTGVDLWYNDVNGNQIRITQSGSIVGTAGSITGLVSPASASYNAISAKFVWQANVNVAADMDFASAIMRKTGVVSSPALTLQVPSSMGSDFTLVLPTLPVSQKIMTLDASGNMAAPYVVDNSSIEISTNTIQIKDDGVTTPKIINAAVTASKLAALNLVASTTSGAFSTNSTSFVPVTNLSNTITNTARPVVVQLVGRPGGFLSRFGLLGTGGRVRIVRDITAIADFDIANNGGTNYQPCNSINFVDYLVTPGTHTYVVNVLVNNAAFTFTVEECILLTYEMS